MSAKLIKAGAGVLAAFLAVNAFAWDQDPFRDGPSEDLISPWCRIDAPETWEGRPCVVPLRTWSAEAPTVPR
jgi:hypothetical protein